MSNNVIDLGKIQKFNTQLEDITRIVNKLTKRRNLDVFNKISKNAEGLFESIRQIDTTNAPLEDIRALISLLKGLRETCVTLVNYRNYLEEISPTVEKLESGVNNSYENEDVSGGPGLQENHNQPSLIALEAQKILQLTPPVSSSNQNAA